MTPTVLAPSVPLPAWWVYTTPLTAAMLQPNPGVFSNGAVIPGTPVITLAGAQALAQLYAGYVTGIQMGPLVADVPNVDDKFTFSQEPYFVYSNGTWGPVSDIWEMFIHGMQFGAAWYAGFVAIQEDMASGQTPSAA